MKPVILFDVNETLLDLAALDPVFEAVFGDAGARQAWFGQVLQSALVLTVLERYEDFSTVAGHALTQLAQRRGIELGADDRARVAEGMKRLPCHPDVPAALRRLADAGFRMAALTNSPPAVADAQLRHAGLADSLEAILTVEIAGRLKPHQSVYTSAARALDVPIGDTLMVAAHGWDIAGAMNAGCRGAFIARPGQVPDTLFPAPDYVVQDLGGLADQLIR
ncbi:haloacid dehalogenase type II [Ectothiorhodospiraceae bacterium WFHF3C12]|nr:haloacid dehalogenase type II [Ectothiorhodospiraceae bacterium WFHF3C12]